MKKIILFLLLIITANILAKDVITINFFNEPKIDKNKIDDQTLGVNKFILSKKDNSINIFSGKIIRQNHNDSLLIYTLNKLVCNVATPTDFKFENPKMRPSFKIITLNISNKRLPIQKTYVIKSDSIKIAIIGIYSPDTFIKNRISEDAEFHYDFIKRLKQTEKKLRDPKRKIDKIILLSNFSREIDKSIAQKVPVDIILSFDYKKRSQKWLTKKTMFCSVISSQGKMGKLMLIYNNGKIRYKWEILKFR